MLTEHSRDDFGGALVARGEDVSVGLQRDRRRGMAEPGGDDMNGDPLGEEVRRVRVATSCSRTGTDLRRGAERAELLSEPLRVDGAAGLVAEDQVLVDVRIAG